jgi:Protein of unknown function (DUF2950)
MQDTSKDFEKRRPGRLFARVSLALLLVLIALMSFLMLTAGVSVGQERNQKTFSSPQQASQALFATVENNDQTTLLQVLGGDKSLVSSGDDLDDQHDRKVFATKYREMHRLVQEPDGTILLYIGAENWPFPVPLVSQNGKWFFDADGGTKEVRFRRIGENEALTLETCQSLAASADQRAGAHSNGDETEVQYVRSLIDDNGAGTGGSSVGEQSSSPLHGYYFQKFQNGKAGTGSRIVVAYPAEYRSSGVMTFVVAPNGAVYEKDLGPQTASVAKAMTTWKADRSWHIAR